MLYNMRIDCHKNAATKSLFYSVHISRTESLQADILEKEPISILQSFFKKRVSVEVRHNHIHMNWRKKVADHHTFRYTCLISVRNMRSKKPTSRTSKCLALRAPHGWWGLFST
jgi:hypothetical protein